jgi:hypothetical protein
VPKKQVNTAYKRYSYVRAEKTEDDYIMGWYTDDFINGLYSY